MFVTIYKDTRKVYSCYTKDLKSTVKKFHKNLKSSPNFWLQLKSEMNIL